MPYIDEPPEFADSIENEDCVILDADLSQMDLLGQSIDDHSVQPPYDFTKKKVSIKLNLEQIRKQQENTYAARS